MDYVFAPAITISQTEYINGMVEDFLHDFVDLYPERRITPKMHYMTHLGSWIKRYIMCKLYECNLVIGVAH